MLQRVRVERQSSYSIPHESCVVLLEMVCDIGLATASTWSKQCLYEFLKASHTLGSGVIRKSEASRLGGDCKAKFTSLVTQNLLIEVCEVSNRTVSDIKI